MRDKVCESINFFMRADGNQSIPAEGTYSFDTATRRVAKL